MKNSLWLLLLLPVMSAAAPSNEAILADFKSQAQIMSREALAKGYHQFGALNFENYLSKLDQTNVKVVKKVARIKVITFLTTERDSAECGSGRINLAGPNWLRTKEVAKPMLSMHEHLCAQNIYDDDFYCSSSIWALTDENVRKSLTDAELAQFQALAEQNCVMARGGSTGVMGGGDDFNVMMRINAMKQGLDKMPSREDEAGRLAQLDSIQNSFFSEYGINPHHPMFDPKTFMHSLQLDVNRTPLESTIFVCFNHQPVPHNAKNGWTYNARTKRVLFHGTAVPGPRVAEGPGVLVKYADQLAPGESVPPASTVCFY